MMDIKRQAEFEAKFDFFYRNKTHKLLLAWVTKYLYKKGIFFSQNPTIIEVKSTLFNWFKDSNGRATFEFYRKMEKAWEAHNRRLACKARMLNISVSIEHKNKFKEMAKEAKITNIQLLQSLIDDNYKFFIGLKDKERKDKETERAKKTEIKYNQSFTDKKLSGELHLQKNYNNHLKKQVTALKSELQAVKDNSSILFAIIEKAVKNRSKLTADHLMQATRAHTLIDIVQLPLDESMQATESEESTEQHQTSGSHHRKRARPAKTASK
ncbi:hypothetical protein AAEH72_14325 [Shewanella xiamenensis]|uniref:hypothetical protein n=1 Tax=Shewanella xiamenensis TaxID=332186 RepID=UPI00313C8F01